MPRRARALPVAAVLALVTLAACGGDGSTVADGGESEVLGEAGEGIDGVQAVRVYYEDPVHAEGEVDYDLRPPAGGMHDAVWWNCGFYDTAVPDEHAVHDLEHGAVWLAYAPGLDEADVAVIHDLVRANPKVLAAPYPGLAEGEAVVATAWARQLRLGSVDDDRLAAFVARYQDGSQAPEAGAGCTGTPLGRPIP
jgi:hypothetical protein